MMMAEQLVEKRFCSACGVDVRPQALFCYNCGASVAPEIGGLKETNGNAVRETEIVPGARVETGEIETKVRKKSPENGDKPIEKPDQTPIEKKSRKKVEKGEKVKLKTAASLRQKAKNQPAEKRIVEVVWEEPDDGPNIWFIVASMLLAIFAVVILIVMLYIR